jgi:RNA polymerase sporulation-specific sigma factor
MTIKFEILLIKARRFLIRLGLLDPHGIYYIGGSDTLPPPLTREEEAGLINRLAADSGAVRQILIERNLRLVVYISRRFENTGVNIEDLISIGSIGLIKAINTYDPNRTSNLPPMPPDASKTRF